MAVNPSPFGPKPQFELASGAPAVGNKLFFYVAGSVNTKQNTYADSTGGSANANPIILNALGQPTNEIWFTAGLGYKAVYAPSTDTDPPTSPIWTIDHIFGINDTTIGVSEWVASGLTPTYVSTISFTLVGDQTVAFHAKRKLQFTVTAGTVYGTILTSVFGALTTVTMTMDVGQVLDSGLSAVNLSILTADHLATPLNATPIVAEKRQTVLVGPVDTNGLAAYGGATGAAVVTTTGIIVATCAAGASAGGTVDRAGSITNASWTGLSTPGTMYLYLDIDANGTVTTGSGTLAPAYQWGGTYSVTANQWTYNIQEGVGKVGNGASASQVYRVYVGEVTVSGGGVTTAIIWYQVLARYVGAWVATLPTSSVAISANHYLGTIEFRGWWEAECTTNDVGYVVGERIDLHVNGLSGTSVYPIAIRKTRLIMGTATTNGSATPILIAPAAGGAGTALTNASWKYRFIGIRSW
jgi:hypothetical protein